MDSIVPSYRPATKADIPGIVDLVNRAYRDGEVRGWTSEADIVEGDRTHNEEIEGLLDSPGSVLLLMWADEHVYGCVHLRAQDAEVYLGMLTIEPRFQNRGLGKGLLMEAERYAQQKMDARGISMIVVGQRTELIDYYLRRGYRLSGETSPYPVELNVGRPKVEGLYMVKLVKGLSV